ncbi:MAG: hypothetical protein IKV56_00220 [Kiritimatiellae bacterium]|nr:hypothetical protein [Kiritimatiellia bacterium]
MIKTHEIIIERVAAAVGEVELDNRGILPERAIAATGFSKRHVVSPGTSLLNLSMKAIEKLPADALRDVGGVVAATFSSERRFPALAASIASRLSLPSLVPAFDLQMACSAYPYAVYLAARMAGDLGKKVLVIDGDVQSSLSDPEDTETTPLFSDAATASIVSAGDQGLGAVNFYTRASDALECGESGPIKMDGFGVFSFVATEVAPFLKEFLSEAGADVDAFIPHQANMYMVRQLAETLGLSDRLLTSGEEFANTGSASIPLTIAHRGKTGRALIAGFGAGLSASCAIVRIKI